jgi:DNA-binding SARP family transcriptional activator
MDFLVLGPLEIISESGAPIPIAQPAHRALLSVLLFYAGQPCSHGKLIDALWGDSPPKDPVRTLLSHMSRIRRHADVRKRLQTLRGAYRIEPGPDELDLHRFHRLRSRARGKLAQGDPEQAAALLAAALECWRDPPLADLPSTPEIDADVAKLLEQRRSTETEFIGLMLALGHHQQVVADLQRIVTADPLAEHSWAQLMIALCRNGRKGEALAAYSKARAALIRSLGTEPGQELQELLGEILSDSDRLRAPARTAPGISAQALDGLPREGPSSFRAARGWPPASSALAIAAACA